ncbi:hypothetical protein AB0O03_00665 [Streptomyces diastaticus]|uniref:hypothetical protein n=1 Tax=Streptomyces diastaticus TaxID=1956 RepID=UPI00343C1E4D
MRSRPPLALVLALASPLTTASAHAVSPQAPTGAAHAPAVPGAHPAGPPVPLCVQPDAARLPLTGRLRDGPATLRAGDGPSGFTVRVHNTGRVTCHRVHPVVLLIDEDRALAPSQLRLDFHDGRRWTPVRLHHTSRRENVGVLDGGKGFRGFTVGPGERRDVRLRLAVREDAGPGRVAVRTALVQHHDRDGRWVGHSDTYTFALRAADGTGPRRPVPPPHPPGNEQPADRRDATPTPVRPPAVPAPPSPWPLPDPWVTGEPPPASRFPTEAPLPTGRPASPPPPGVRASPAHPAPSRHGTPPPSPGAAPDGPDAEPPTGRTPDAEAPTGPTPEAPDGAPGRAPRSGPGDSPRHDGDPRHPASGSGEGRPELAETGDSALSPGVLAVVLPASGAVLLRLARRPRRP